jgi:predicted dehydrogenase
MRTIFLGNAPRSTQWREALRTFARAEFVGTVGSADRADQSIPQFSSLQDALAKASADLAIVSGGSTAAATEAAGSGLAVILDRPSTAGAADLAALRDASARSERATTLVCAANRYARRANLIGRFLASRKLGAVGHVSCIDHRRAAADDLGSDASAQLLSTGCGHILSVQTLLGARPLSVMAQLSTQSPQRASTAAFVELEKGLHIQYFGSIGPEPSHHELWIEGTGGSLITDGGNVSWRKRGWRFFVPLRLSLGSVDDDEHGARLAALATIGTPGKATADPLDALALATAAIESHEGRRIVPISSSVSLRGAQK